MSTPRFAYNETKLSKQTIMKAFVQIQTHNVKYAIIYRVFVNPLTMHFRDYC